MEFDIEIDDPIGLTTQTRFRLHPSPLVSCLMVTRGAADVCRQAIGQFHAQTYGHRELIVMSQQHDAPVRSLIATLGDLRIRFVDGPPGSLGALRNASVAAARGPLVCQWDDDDLYDKRRIELMVSAWAATKTDAVFLKRVTLWWPSRRKLALAEPRLWEGSMLAEKDKLPPFPDLERREDTGMVDVLRKQARVASLDAPGAYVYRVTGQNTWDAAFFEDVFARASQDLSHEYDARTAAWPKLG